MATSTSVPDAFGDWLQEFVGQPYGVGLRARDPVNLPMIRHLTDALGDRNPIYTDPEFAARSVFGGIVAPATALQVWTMQGLAPPRPRDADDSQARLMQALDEAGYVGVVATDCEQTYHRYLRPGDRLHTTAVVESISPFKRTALGEGYFVTTLQTYRDQHDEVVGEMRFRILKFKPGTGRAAPAAAPAAPGVAADRQESPVPRPEVPPPLDAAFFWEGAERKELRIQRCVSCGRLRHPPRPMCPQCRSLERDHVVASGRGVVFSYVVHHHPPVPGRDSPFVVALVELEEGTRIVGNLLDVPPAEVEVGMPVEVCWVRAADGQTDPHWRPRGRSAGEGVRTSTRRFDDVEVGETLPELSIPLTPTLIVSTAIATRDYQDVHHDRDLAQQKGSKDIFMNILTTNGFVGRFVTDWTGPEAVFESVSIRLGAPNYPYDRMTLAGRVVSKEIIDGRGVVELEIVGRNGLGDHVTGRVRLALPTGEGAR